MNVRRLTLGLGWFSIVLGAAQLFVPQQLERLLGLGPHRTLLRTLGMRELLPGIAIVTQPNPAL